MILLRDTVTAGGDLIKGTGLPISAGIFEVIRDACACLNFNSLLHNTALLLRAGKTKCDFE